MKILSMISILFEVYRAVHRGFFCFFMLKFFLMVANVVDVFVCVDLLFFVDCR